MRRLGFVCVLAAVAAVCGCDTRHSAQIYKLKNHHIVMRDDKGRWFEYVLKNADIDFDIPWADSGNFTPTLPAGGSWRGASQQEIDEVSNNEAGEADTTVDETSDGAPDGDGDVGDSGGDGGGDE